MSSGTRVLGFALTLALGCAAVSFVGAHASTSHAGSGVDVPDGARVECFVLEDHTSGHADLVGFAQWRRRETADGPQLEREIRFLEHGDGPTEIAPDTLVNHVENLSTRGARLVWREIGGDGRALLAEWGEAGELRLREWGTCGRADLELQPREGAIMPLYLDELLRLGCVVSGQFEVFDPRTRALERIDVRCVYGEAGARSESEPALRQRTSELRRADGTLFERLRFEGADLVGFQLQDGGPWARRVTSADYEERRRALDPAQRAAESDRNPHVAH